MRSARRAAALAVAGASLASAVSGCGFRATDLSFRSDDRLRITAPEERERTRLPVTVRWTMRDFDVIQPGSYGGGVEEDQGYFAVFVDRAPVPPGETLRHVSRKDRSCRAAEGCPDRDYLEARGVYTTGGSSVTLQTLAQTAKEGRREFHTVTVVILDARGRRIGESAWQVRFEVDRRGRS